jgi:hypothetical protein
VAQQFAAVASPSGLTDAVGVADAEQQWPTPAKSYRLRVITDLLSGGVVNISRTAANAFSMRASDRADSGWTPRGKHQQGSLNACAS